MLFSSLTLHEFLVLGLGPSALVLTSPGSHLGLSLTSCFCRNPSLRPKCLIGLVVPASTGHVAT